jgi:acyl carrier protein
MADIKKSIRIFILEEFGIKDANLDDKESLFDSGIIDSLGMVTLIAFIEGEFKIVINPSEVTMDNFNTINKIAELINKKR